MYACQSDFQTLPREVRKVEKEESATTKPVLKPKTAQHHTSQASSDTFDSSNQMLKAMNELVGKMKSMESQLAQQKQANDSLTTQSHSFQDGGYRNQLSRGRSHGFGRSYGQSTRPGDFGR